MLFPSSRESGIFVLLFFFFFFFFFFLFLSFPFRFCFCLIFVIAPAGSKVEGSEGDGAAQHKTPEVDESLSPAQRGFALSHKSEKRNVNLSFSSLFLSLGSLNNASPLFLLSLSFPKVGVSSF